MSAEHRNDLVRFLTDSAQEAAVTAHASNGNTAVALSQEAEELLALRARLIARQWAAEQAAQLQLPFDIKAAA